MTPDSKSHGETEGDCALGCRLAAAPRTRSFELPPMAVSRLLKSRAEHGVPETKLTVIW